MKTRIKKYLKRIIAIIREKNKKQDFDPPSIWINKIFKKNKIFIVQVGSNDGINGDPLYYLIQKNKNWEALFIEPVPYLFERLKKNYQNQSRFKFENMAINDGSYQTFYSVKDSANMEIPNLPKWYDQLGSFNRENITKHLNGVLEPYIIETRIKGVYLPDILKANKINSIDLIHIDAEGYDWVILSQLDLNLFHPQAILFEHKHLKLKEKQKALEYLVQHNYTVFQLGADFIAIKLNNEIQRRIKNLKGVKISQV